jgi:hypothetical protein
VICTLGFGRKMEPGILSAIVEYLQLLPCAYLDRIPILAGEGVHSLLLKALLAF